MLRAIGYLFALVVIAIFGVAGGGLYVFYKYGSDLPDYAQLETYEPPTMTRVHAADGRLLTEYATERRVFVPVGVMPKSLIQAFLAAEDKNFFEHRGVDFLSVARAAVTNISNFRENKRPIGASTITQQVAKNFLLTSEVSLERKIKEAILAFRMERVLSKERILELYLNEIYLGIGSYGVAAASLNYFNKSLDDLTLEEVAYLAALPKAPNNYHPVRRAAAAKARRNWVLSRMAEEGYIAASEATLAGQRALQIRSRDEEEFFSAEYFTEEVRRILFETYGEEGLYKGGMSVRTTLDPRLQAIAERTLRAGLIAYDRRHGWRGPIATLEVAADWPARLGAIEAPAGLDPWQLALVLKVADDETVVGLASGSQGVIPFDELSWARPWLKGQKVGPRVKRSRDVLREGDVVAVERLPDTLDSFALRQLPVVQGALVAMDPHTGRVHAMVGGYSFEQSQFNRATQAQRQPGSAFKPFVYAAALENGFTPASRVLDAPFVVDQGPGLGKWKPANYTKRFYGPSTLRLGLEKSRNLMTVRLAQFLGMEAIADYARRFGINDDLPPMLSMALGAGETTLMQLTAGYAMMVNGGRRIEPSLIDRIQDRRGRTVMRHDTRTCTDCEVATGWRHQAEPVLPDLREQIIDSATAYQMVSMLQGVIQRGTGVGVRSVGKPLAGKTGTTNASQDAWFIGFSPDLAVGVYVGFDEPRTLGPREQGASVAAPIFRDFMVEALADEPNIPFRIPRSVRLVRIDYETGLPARNGSKSVILEAFRPGTEPSDAASAVLDDAGSFDAAELGSAGVGGLY
ncbi:MAG: penicillin-binding protein 1A [Proteobacteria bacterium]|nr:penicillin-binding protein 1A [Pseudomonadota bacterium]